MIDGWIGLGMPRWVYHPAEDRLGPPRLLDPTSIADAVASYVDDRARYRSHSAAALAHVTTEFDPASCLDGVLEVLSGFLAARPRAAVSR
jgi:glycosyltransferase involved in cell wall biosynthesis